MSEPWRPAPGQKQIESAALTIAKAQEFCAAIGVHPYATLLECRGDGKKEVIVFETDVEVPQRPAAPIRGTEKLAASFSPDDASYPEVVSLRSDFPTIPHLNMRPIGDLPSLCLYEEPYSEVKLKWTGFRFLERIRTFLGGTAKGELHAPDQPLEPLVSPSAHVLTISNEFLSAPNGTVDFFSLAVQESGGLQTFVASRRPGQARNSIALLLEGSVRGHGIIAAAPSNIQELHDFAVAAEIRLIDALQDALLKYKVENPFPATNNAYVFLLLRLPKSRVPGGPKETDDLCGFFCFEQLGTLGEKLGLWSFHNGTMGMLLDRQSAIRARDVNVQILRPQLAMSPALGAALSGTNPQGFAGVFIGVGALGSNVLSHFVRTGFGRWTIIDRDLLMSHNFARHAAHWGVGMAKVEVVSQQFNVMFDELSPLTPLQGDLLNSADSSTLQVLQEAPMIIDCAATVPVSRFLAIDVASDARRISAFLNPQGTDVVLLVEDKLRNIRLDHLEIQYYTAIVRDPALRDHLRRDDLIHRYSNGCRDTSAVIPEENIAISAGLVSAAIRRAHLSDSAMIAIWIIDSQTMAVRSHLIQPSHFRSYEMNGWTVFVDQILFVQLQECRRSRLPRETGGVLVGSFDTQRRILYIVEQIASPKDSQERPSSYIRGCEGLEARTKEISRLTQHGLEYVGEWHSHPDGYDAERSKTDWCAIHRLSELMFPEGLPVVMLIAAENDDNRVYVETPVSLASPQPPG